MIAYRVYIARMDPEEILEVFNQSVETAAILLFASEIKNDSSSSSDLATLLEQFRDMEAGGMLSVFEMKGDEQTKQSVVAARALLDWDEDKSPKSFKNVMLALDARRNNQNPDTPRKKTNPDSVRISQLRDQFQRPYVEAVSNFRITQLGDEADIVSRNLKSLFGRKKSLDAANQFLDGVILRIAKNRLKMISEKEKAAISKTAGIKKTEIEPIHLIDETHTMLTAMMYKNHGYISYEEYINREGYMPLIMFLIESGNAILDETSNVADA